MLTLSLASAVYRAFGLMLALALLPRSLVPLSVKVALTFSIIVLVSGTQEQAIMQLVLGYGSNGSSSAVTSTTDSVLSLFPGNFVSWTFVIAELSFGILTGLILSVSAYSVFLLGQWLSAALASPGVLRERYLRQSCGSIRPFLLILFLALFFSSDAPAQLMTTVGRSLLLIPSAQALESVQLQGLALRLVASLGILAFEVALLVAAPFLLSFLVIDLSMVVIERHYSGTVKLQYPLKIMLACLLLSFGVYVLHEQLLSIITETVIDFDADAFLRALR